MDVQTIRRRSGSSWITVYSAYTAPTASASPTSLSGHRTGALPTGFASTSGSATVTVNNGTGNNTYTWERVSGSSIISPISGSSASTGFMATGFQGVAQAVYRCRVSDGVTTVYTNNVSITLTYTYDPGGGPGGPGGLGVPP